MTFAVFLFPVLLLGVVFTETAQQQAAQEEATRAAAAVLDSQYKDFTPGKPPAPAAGVLQKETKPLTYRAFQGNNPLFCVSSDDDETGWVFPRRLSGDEIKNMLAVFAGSSPVTKDALEAYCRQHGVDDTKYEVPANYFLSQYKPSEMNRVVDWIAQVGGGITVSDFCRVMYAHFCELGFETEVVDVDAPAPAPTPAPAASSTGKYFP